MRTAGPITSAIYPRTRRAGICLALPSAARFSRTDCSSLLITRASVLISQLRPPRIRSLPPLSAVEIFRRFAPGNAAPSRGQAVLVQEEREFSCTLPVRHLPLPALPPRRSSLRAVHSRPIRSPHPRTAPLPP